MRCYNVLDEDAKSLMKKCQVYLDDLGALMTYLMNVLTFDGLDNGRLYVMMKDYILHMIDNTSLSWGHDDIYEPRSLDEETKQQ